MEIKGKLRHLSMNQYIAGDIDERGQRESLGNWGVSGMLHAELCKLGSLGGVLRRQNQLDPKQKAKLPEAFVGTSSRVSQQAPLSIEQARKWWKSGEWDQIIHHVGLKIDNVFMKVATAGNEDPRLVLRLRPFPNYAELPLPSVAAGGLSRLPGTEGLPSWFHGISVMSAY